MVKNIYTSLFVSIELNVEEELLFITWLDTTDNILDNEYRNEILNIIDLVTTYQPKFILDDARLYNSPIVPETQEWVAETVFQTFQTLSKYAMVMPKEFFGGLSAALNIDEVQKMGEVNVKTFPNLEEAHLWIKEYN